MVRACTAESRFFVIPFISFEKLTSTSWVMELFCRIFFNCPRSAIREGWIPDWQPDVGAEPGAKEDDVLELFVVLGILVLAIVSSV